MVDAAHACTVKALPVKKFINNSLRTGHTCPTVMVLDNASIHHGIDAASRQRWPDHKDPPPARPNA
ncbi:hypothetical protein [Paraburkholderia humisilvae]|uniref:Tc1-like transposase DDE domain-containing protein n=1 Tax=Paraburkholderia humisilvae TaxID=627669 RepID=A0A6J5F8Z1_9BURK|nr:hypothetical protein [Paraburkholderia humisilvae]CAB3774843.1 hypothetical protein LMG29542_08225 [Paraburkholderia humisilvae]